MVIGAVFTSIYSFKLIYYTFFSKPNSLNYTMFYNNRNTPEFPLTIIYLIIFSILVLGSIFFGFFSKEFLLSTPTGDLEFYPYYIKLIPILLTFLGILLGFVIIDPWKNIKMLTIMNKRFFFDSLFNYFFAFQFLNFGYLFTFKLLDRGLFEFLGPLGFIRVFYSIPAHYTGRENMGGDEVEEGSNLYIYLLITFLILLGFFFFF